MSGADHYEVLNVERTASTAEIKSAYRKLVRQVHPDQGGNAALFRLVQEAWTTLSDPAKRAAYDRDLDRPSSPEPPHHEPPPRPEPDWTWSTDQPWTEGPPKPPGPGPSSEHPPTGNSSEHQRTGDWTEQPWTGEATGARLTAPPGPVLISPIFGRWRLPALVALALWIAVLVTVVVTTEVHSAWDALVYVGLAGMLVLALPPHWSRRIPLRRPFQTVGVVTAALYLLMLLPFTKTDLTTLDRILVIGLGAGVVVVRFLTGRWSKYHALDKAIDRDAAFEFNLWGRPGEPLVSSAPAAPITEYDALLQRRTATLLDPVVAALPAAKLVHGAQLGGVVVDHLLLNGRRAALINSLVGPPGTYSLDAYGELQVNGHPLPSRVSALQTTVAAWGGRLRQVDVRGFLIIHPDQGAITTQPQSDAAVTLLPAASAARDLHTWLRPEGNEVDRAALYDILHRAPYGLR